MWSIEDELGSSQFAVIDGALRRLTIREYDFSSTLTQDVAVMREGLVEIASTDAAWERLRDAFARHDSKLADEREAKQRAAAERVAAIARSMRS